MENYDRFTEIQESAMNAEDASVLQYAKTLDSLETKLNKISNSFQQFYMQIANGPAVGGFLDIFNNIITNLSAYDPVTALTKVLTLVSTIKNIVRMLFSFISATTTSYFTQLKTNANQTFGDSTAWQKLGEKIGKWLGVGVEKGVRDQNPVQNGLQNGAIEGSTEAGRKGFKGWITSANGIRTLSTVGATMSTVGLGLDTSTGAGYGISTGLQTLGGGSTAAAQWLLGDKVGAVITGVSTIVGLVESIAKWDEKRLENLKAETEELNTERVEDKTAAADLQSYTTKYEKLKAAQYDSAEAAQEYIDIQNEIAEKYPQFVSYMDESGNAIVNMSSAAKVLSAALQTAIDSTEEYVEKLLETRQEELSQAEKKLFRTTQYDRQGRPDYSAIIENNGANYKRAAYEQLRTYMPNLMDTGVLEDEDKWNEAWSKIGLIEDSSLKEKAEYISSFFGVTDLASLAEKMNQMAEAGGRSAAALINSVVEGLLGDVFDVEDWTYSVNSNYKNVLDGQASLLSAKQQSLLLKTNSYSNAYLQNGEHREIFKDITGEESIIQQMVYDKYLENPQDFDKGEYTAIANAFSTLLYDSNDKLNYVFIEYLKDWNLVTNDQFSKLIAQLRADKKDKEAIQSVEKFFNEQWLSSAQRLATNLGEETTEDNVKTLFGNLSADQIDEYNDQVVALNTIIATNNNPTEYAQNQIEQQKALLQKYYQSLDKVSSEVRTKMLTNFGTSEWAEQFTDNDIKELVDAGIIDSKQDLIDVEYEVYNTYINAASTRLTTIGEAFSEAAEKHFGSGFSLSEAKTFINDLSLDLENFKEYFTYDILSGTYRFASNGLEKIQATITDKISQLTEEQGLWASLLDQEDSALFNAENLGQWNLTNAQREQLQQIINNISQGTLTEDRGRAQIEEILADTALSIDAANELQNYLNTYIVDQQRQKWQASISPSSISDLDATYRNADGTINEAALTAAGIVWDKITDNLTLTVEYWQKIAQNTTDTDLQAYATEQIRELENAALDLGSELVGKITQEQINTLKAAYGKEAVAGLTAGSTWESSINAIPQQLQAAAQLAQAANREQIIASAQSSAEDIVEAVVSGQTLTVEALQEFWETLHPGEYIDQAALDEMTAMLATGSLQSLYKWLEDQMDDSQASYDAIAKAMKTIYELVGDLLVDAVSNSISNLESAGKGTITRANITSLAQQAGMDVSTLMAGASTSKSGYKLTTDALLKAAGGIVGNSPGSLQDVAQWLVDSDMLDYSELISKEIQDWGDEGQNVVKVLKTAQSIIENMADNAEWFDENFPGSVDDKFQNFIDRLEKASGLINNIADGEKVEWSDAQWLFSSVKGTENFTAAMDKAGYSVAEFEATMARCLDLSTGTVDFGRVLSEMGMSLGDFNDTFVQSAREFAENRVTYLQGLLTYLDSQEKFVEGLNNTNSGVRQAFENFRTAVLGGSGNAASLWITACDKLDAAVSSAGLGKTFLEAFGIDLRNVQGVTATNVNGFINAVVDAITNAEWTEGTDKDALLSNIRTSLIASWADLGVTLGGTSETISDSLTSAGESALATEKTLEDLKNSAENGISAISKYADAAKAALASSEAVASANLKKWNALIDTITNSKNIPDKIKPELIATVIEYAEDTTQSSESKASLVGALTAVVADYQNAENLSPEDELQLNALQGVLTAYDDATARADLENSITGLTAVISGFDVVYDSKDTNSKTLDSWLTGVVKITSFVDDTESADGTKIADYITGLTATVSNWTPTNLESLSAQVNDYIAGIQTEVALQFANDGDVTGLTKLWGQLDTTQRKIVFTQTKGESAAKTVLEAVRAYTDLSRVTDTIQTRITINEAENQEAISATQEQVNNLANGEYNVVITGDAINAIAAIDSAWTKAKNFVKAPFIGRLEMDYLNAQVKVEKVQSQTEAFTEDTHCATVQADTTEADTTLDNTQENVDELVGQDYEIDISGDASEAINTADEAIKAIGEKEANIKINITDVNGDPIVQAVEAARDKAIRAEIDAILDNYDMQTLQLLAQSGDENALALLNTLTALYEALHRNNDNLEKKNSSSSTGEVEYYNYPPNILLDNPTGEDDSASVTVDVDTTEVENAEKMIVALREQAGQGAYMRLKVGPVYAGGSGAATIFQKQWGLGGNANARGRNNTLVGELGPELAVYNDAYHLLGAGGAEFVDIPENAIIFNHKQTAQLLRGKTGVRGRTLNGKAAFARGKNNAYASGSSGARSAIEKEIAYWQGMLSNLTVENLVGSGSGGGGGNSLEATIEDLTEWYNLTRQIADIEQKINNIQAERKNLTDGREYLKSLREEQHLLEAQSIVQQTLLGYQQKQLELQAEQINSHNIWSKFLTVDEDGLLQYIKGNEENGGKGTLTLLQQLNKMSGTEQLATIKKLGYSYTDNDGKVLDGSELVEQFYQELQDQIDKYDELRDTVEETDETLEELETSMNDITKEIRENQEELEQTIYDTLVEAWEDQINQLQEQTDLLKTANEEYVDGLSDALTKEKELYSQNQSIADRQQLQRQLSLLRRSGGSASQIASLEEQLDSSLQEEYYEQQQKTIDSIKEANEKQLDAMNKQITLQQEALDFQKENGVLWTKVYEVLSKSDGEILGFLSQNSSKFIQSSALVQADTLNEDWAKRIGIYKANSEEGYEPYAQQAAANFASQAWNDASEGASKKAMFDALDGELQNDLAEYFISAFANEMLAGNDEEGAYAAARKDMYKKIYQSYSEQISSANTTLEDARKASSTGGSGGSSKSGSGGSIGSKATVTVVAGNNGGHPTLVGSQTQYYVGQVVTVAPNPAGGYAFSYMMVNGQPITGTSFTITSTVMKARCYYINHTIYGGGGSRLAMTTIHAATGALIHADNTPAILHKGEGVFTAAETSALRGMVKNYQTLAANVTGNSLLSAINGVGSYSFSNMRGGSSELNINPGAVVINVDKLDDKYDVDELATDVFNKLTSIASKATNRGVSRR